jgi:hypothetical protein
MQVLSDVIDGQIYCIHASKRTDRSQLFQTWSKMHKININIFPAIIDTDGRKGCALSHIALSKLLLQNVKSDKYALILEDDAVPTLHSSNAQLISDILLSIHDKKFDIIWLGGLPSWNSYFTEYKSIREGPSWTTHAMLVNRNYMQWMANFQYNGIPIDVELAKAPLKMAWVYPSLLEQADTQSNIRRTVLSQTGAFGSFLLWWTVIWRCLVFHKQFFLVFILSILISIYISNYIKCKN